jgi:hypothetical protein
MPKIKSNSSPDSPRPWFEFTFNAATLEVTFTKANGISKAISKVTKAKESALKGKRKVKIKAGKESEVHVLAITLEGDVEFVPVSEQRPEYYAHLAWYDPTTGSLDALEFEEEAGSTDDEIAALPDWQVP